ncbi:MAG: hypothetical protein M1374_08090 [Firmicutes bacterium]|jgi:ribosome maturation factor RimP|nr:hypothetical protein [Bacillota bacterium]
MHEDLVRSELDGLCRPLDVTVYDVIYRQEKLVVMLDRHPKPLSLDELATISAKFSSLLDTREDLLGVLGNFELEVTTPGLERPLRNQDHFRQVIGKRLAIKLKRALGGRRRLWGVLTHVDESEIKIIDVADSESSVTSSPAISKKKNSKVKETSDKKADFLHTGISESITSSTVFADYQGIIISMEDIEEAHLYFDWKAALAGTEFLEQDTRESEGVEDLEFFIGEDLSTLSGVELPESNNTAREPSRLGQAGFSSKTANKDTDRRANNG